MMWQSRWQSGLAVAILSPWLVFAAETQPGSKAAITNASDSIVELKGKLVPMPPPVTRAALRTESGEIYTLISNRMSSALFLDTNLQAKVLLLGGRVLPGTGAFEVTRNLRSVRDGKVQELFYYCDVCTITGTDPGECMCCRDPVHLVEEESSNSGFRIPKAK